MSLDARVETLKFARLVGAEPDDLSYLHDLAAQDIRDLREQVTVTMFDADGQLLQRVAAATKLIPAKLAAAIAERAFGPLLCARVTGLLDPGRAVDIAGRLPTQFLAELAAELDPRRASRVIAEIPPEQVAEITRELAADEQFIVMGSFVGHLSEAALRAATDVIDDEALLLTAYVIEAKGNLAALVGLLPSERLETVIRAAHEHDLWSEALDVLRHVSERQRGVLGDLAAAQEDAVLDSMVSTAQREGLWQEVLPVTRAMSQDSRARFARLRSVGTQPMLASILEAASRHGMWAELLTLLPLLPASARRRAAELASDFEPSILEQVIGAAHEHGLWPPLIAFASELEDQAQVLIASLIAKADDDVIDGLLEGVEPERYEAEIGAIMSNLRATDRKRFAQRVAKREAAELPRERAHSR